MKCPLVKTSPTSFLLSSAADSRRGVEGIAVGTSVARGPPHGSGRALLTHPALALSPGVEPQLRPRVQNLGGRYPVGFEPSHSFPGEPGALAASLQRRMPCPDHLSSEGPKRVDVRRDRVVLEISAHYAPQPPSLLGHGLVATSPQLFPDCAESSAHPFGHRLAFQQEPPRLGPGTDVREPKEREGLRLALMTCSSVFGGKLSELDQPRLLRVQFQAESVHTLSQSLQEAPRSLRRPSVALGPFPLFQHPRAQPFLDEPQDSPIRDPVPEEPHQPFVA